MNEILSSIHQGLADAKAHRIEHYPFRLLETDLRSMWDPSEEVLRCPLPDDDAEEVDVRMSSGDDSRDTKVDWARPRYPAVASRAAPRPKRPPPWYVGLSKDFSKAISGLDRKLQGRILEALNEITSDPTRPRGDTIKRLTGDLNGCWRYRIGDYRLVYSPDAGTGDITLLAFAARSSIYAD